MMEDLLPSSVVRMVSLFLEDLGTPISLSQEIKLRYGEWDALSDFTPEPRQYLTASQYAADAAACGLLRKLNELPTTHNRRANAIEKWWQGERDCYWSNERLCRYLPEFLQDSDVDDLTLRILRNARQLIRSWIGDRPPELVSGRFGPGATFSDRGGRTTVPDKIQSDPVMTSDARCFLPQWIGTAWGAIHAQRQGKVSFVPGNRFSTVPKTSKTDRSIASEPSINVFYQLGLGRVLRRRLKKHAGWDLDRAQDVHRQIAETSSVTREFATLDLSNASDTVSKTLVKLLLPHEWFSQLDDLRSKKTLIDGKWVVLEKFSSMGNGFTFELETIIFAAVSCAVARECGYIGNLGYDVFCFGDDIIVKNDVAHPLKLVLEVLGFSLNLEKSFFGDEPFRESCGADFFAGKPVRPYFLKELPDGPQDFVVLANGLRALIERCALAGVSIRWRAWLSVLDNIPSGVRSCRGPQDLGDIVIHDDKERWNTRWRSGIRYFRAYRPWRMRITPFSVFPAEVVLACAVYGTGNLDPKHIRFSDGAGKGKIEGVIPRDSVLSYKIGWVPWS